MNKVLYKAPVPAAKTYKLGEIKKFLENEMKLELAEQKTESSVRINVLKAERDLDLNAIQCPKSLKKGNCY